MRAYTRPYSGSDLRESTTPTQRGRDQGRAKVAFTLSGKTRVLSKDGKSLTGSPKEEQQCITTKRLDLRVLMVHGTYK
jgi:hypothetical protein